jgi:hypothetical protein
VARDEEIPPQDAPAGERRGVIDRHGTEHKATAHVLGQGTEEVGAGSSPAASGTDSFSERPTPPGRPSSEIHTAPRTFFNGLGFSSKFGGELLRIIDNARRAALWPLSPPKPHEQNLLVPLVGWPPSENLSQRSSCSATHSLAKWSSLDRPKLKWTKRPEQCSHGRRTGGLECRLGCCSAGRS